MTNESPAGANQSLALVAKRNGSTVDLRASPQKDARLVPKVANCFVFEAGENCFGHVLCERLVGAAPHVLPVARDVGEGQVDGNGLVSAFEI